MKLIRKLAGMVLSAGGLLSPIIFSSVLLQDRKSNPINKAIM
jgi:hypothetical protein